MLFPRIIILFLVSAALLSCREDSAPAAPDIDPIQQTEPGLIKITSPVLSENWHPGTIQTIKWEAGKNIYKVDILLYRKDIKILTIADGINNTSSYEWEVPTNIDYSHHYRVKIVDAKSKLSENFSDFFYIIAEGI